MNSNKKTTKKHGKTAKNQVETVENEEKTTKKPFKMNYDKKAQINNEIIQSQGKFKQAKICTIRKLVEKLKHPEKNPKQNRTAKIERYQNVLNQLKQLSPKRLGLLALINYKSGKNYLAIQSSTVEQLAVAYFTEYKTVGPILDAIRNKLNLDDSSNWKKLAKKLFRKNDKTSATEGEKETTETEESSDGKGLKKKAKANAKTNEKSIKSKTPSSKETKKQKRSNKSIEQKDTTPSESDESEEESDKETENENTDTAPATTVDDFFITADGSNYLATAVANTKQEEDLDDDHHPNRGKEFAKKPKEASFFHKSDKKPVKLAVNRFENKKRKWSDNEEEEVHTVKESKVDPELHPSWQAKQKQKPIITEFKGKKITFD